MALYRYKAVNAADLDELVVVGTEAIRAQQFFQDENETARASVDGQFLPA